MKKGWPKKSLGEICGFVRGPFGGSLKKSVFVADGFAVYEQQHAIYDQFDDIRYFIDDAKFREMQRFELRPNDLIMSCSGTMGKVAIVPENIRRGIINQALLKLTPTKTVSPEFLKYWMDSTDFQDSLKEQSGGAAIQNVASVSILKEIQISLPPLAEQQRIVGLLDEAFEGLATAKANAEKNLQNARALFESHIQSVFTQRGPGWQTKTLEEACQFSNGLWKGEKPPFVKVGVIRNTNFTKEGTLDDSDIAYLDVEAKKLEKRRLQFGDIILEKSGGGPKQPVGRVALFDKEEGDFSFSNFTAALRVLDPDDLDFRFVHKFLHWTYLSGVTKGMQSNSTGIRNLDGDAYKAIEISFPPLAEQQRIVDLLASLHEETQRLARLYERKHAALEALKKSLLHQAFTGEL